MRIILALIVISFCQCSDKANLNNSVSKRNNWTEAQKRKYFAENFAFRYGWGGGYFKNDTGETFIQFLNTHYPEVRSSHFDDPFLYALEEPFIDTARIDTTKHWFRFLIIESFSHPLSLVLEKKNGKAYFTTKLTDGIGGRYTGNLKMQWTITYPERFYDSICLRMQERGFWQMAFEDQSCAGGTDGGRWTVEAIDNGKYKYIHRWSPDHCGDTLSRNLGETGRQLLMISKKEEMIKAAIGQWAALICTSAHLHICTSFFRLSGTGSASKCESSFPSSFYTPGRRK